jgi:hypothetical protein
VIVSLTNMILSSIIRPRPPRPGSRRGAPPAQDVIDV